MMKSKTIVLRTLLFCWLTLSSFSLLSTTSNGKSVDCQYPKQPWKTGLRHIDEASKWIDYVETGDNRGYWVDKWNRYVHNPLGSPYCSAFVSACLEIARVVKPVVRSGYSRAFVTREAFTVADVWHGKIKLKAGDIVIFKRPTGGHIGFIYGVGSGGKINTIEANTSNGQGGSQWNGGGIYKRVRTINVGTTFRITHFLRVVT